MGKDVDIRGRGVSACCAAHLLAQQGFSVCLEQASRSGPARLLLSGQTQLLFREIFGDPQLFEAAPRIRCRVVAWGAEAPPVELPHSGVVVSEQELLDHLWQKIEIPGDVSLQRETTDAGWTILSAPLPSQAWESRAFGDRKACTRAVRLVAQARHDCCWIESLPDGWLFLLPYSEGRAMLISTGYLPGSLIEQSRLIAAQITELEAAGEPAIQFSAYPQTLCELSGMRWLACGSAAMRFDPLCGEGAGHAVREGLLAAAVIRGAARGYSSDTLLAHYNQRLMQGFLRHLQVCLPFYQSGGQSDFWQAEASALQTGIRWMEARLEGETPPLYRLSGYQLEPIAGN